MILKDLVNTICDGERVEVITQKKNKTLFIGTAYRTNNPSHKVLRDSDNNPADPELYERNVYCIMTGAGFRLLVYVF